MHGPSFSPAQAYQSAYQFQVPSIARQADIHAGTLPPIHGVFAWTGENLVASSLKISEQTGDVMIRWVNHSREDSLLSVRAAEKDSVYRSNVLEERMESLTINGGEATVMVGPAEIVTIAIVGRG